MIPPIYQVADLFCGAGGSSTGAEKAILEIGGRMELVAVNHWPIAVQTHQLNHPAAQHYLQDLDKADPEEIVPNGYLDLLMASPECRFYSRARGGRPIHNDADEAKDGRPPAGRRAAAVLMLAVNEAGGRALIVPPAPGCKDYADECAQGPDFGPLPEGWDHYATTLRETTNWPRWEIARVATTIMQELSNDD